MIDPLNFDGRSDNSVTTEERSKLIEASRLAGAGSCVALEQGVGGKDFCDCRADPRIE